MQEYNTNTYIYSFHLTIISVIAVRQYIYKYISYILQLATVYTDRSPSYVLSRNFTIE